MKRKILTAAMGPASNAGGSGEHVDRARIDALLSELATKPAPANLEVGACCYSPVSPPSRVEYICPVCGAKTLHAESDLIWMVDRTLEDVRMGTAKLRELGLSATLDETFLCSVCARKDAPARLFLKVTLDGRTVRTAVKVDTDIALLEAFLKGESVWKDEFEGEYSVKDMLPRIRRLLGVPKPESDPGKTPSKP
jgi:hypothetical protein